MKKNKKKYSRNKEYDSYSSNKLVSCFLKFQNDDSYFEKIPEEKVETLDIVNVTDVKKSIFLLKI